MRAPRITEHPGAGRIREQTLDEYMAALPEDHLAREQLAEIRAMSLTGMKAINELVDANQKVRELEEKMRAISKPPEAPSGNALPPPTIPSAGSIHPRAQCPYCQKQISTVKGPWAAHMRLKHSDRQFAPAPVYDSPA